MVERVARWLGIGGAVSSSRISLPHYGEVTETGEREGDWREGWDTEEEGPELLEEVARSVVYRVASFRCSTSPHQAASQTQEQNAILQLYDATA